MTAVQVTVAETQAVSTQLTRSDVIDLIATEAHCTTEMASRTLDYISSAVQAARSQSDGVHFMTTRQLNSPLYEVFDAIMQHGKAAKPGSAHEAVETLLLDRTKDETSIWHDTRYDEVSSRYFCTVQVALGIIR